MRFRGVFLAAFVIGGAGALIPTVETLLAAVDPHAYFNTLVARRDVFKAYSLRPVAGQPITSPYYEKQLGLPKELGYAKGNSSGYWVTYDRNNDNDAHAQDAAKVVIPAFSATYASGTGTLTSAIGSATNPVTLANAYGPLYNYNGRSVLIDSEIMDIYDPDGSSGPLKAFDRDTGVMYVRRGQRGTSAANHSGGAYARLSVNTVPNGLRLPLNTSDGHVYFFTWEGYWTDSYIRTGLTNHKTFNFMSDGIWLEPNTNFGGGVGAGKVSGFNPDADVAAYMIRSYNKPNGPSSWTLATEDYAGPGVTATEPLAPQMTTYTFKPNRWVRFFVRLDQRANDYDYVDTWIADEVNGPIPIHKQLKVSVREGRIEEFAVEFNTSTDTFTRGNMRDLVAYIRNFVSLQDPGDITDLLQRPNSDGVIRPGAPSNVRIISGP
jgi:hypothetical protein